MNRIKLLQASVSVDAEDDSELRILLDGKHIKYLTIKPGVYEAEDMCFEPAIVSMLPPLPDEEWISATIGHDLESGQPCFISTDALQLPGVTHTWHDYRTEYLQLTIGEKLRSNVYKAFDPRLNKDVVLKFARFYWEIPQLDMETEAYAWIRGLDIGPEFLGHVTEDDRVIGFLIEEVTNVKHAAPEDLAACENVLKQLHNARILHGDVNRHNFLVGDDRAVLIDFEVATRSEDESLLVAELDSLSAELSDTSGRGGCVQEVSGSPIDMNLVNSTR